jgi:hypothetical protein
MALCRLCGQTISFDKEFKSEYTGKLIPLNEKVNEPHGPSGIAHILLT